MLDYSVRSVWFQHSLVVIAKVLIEELYLHTQQNESEEQLLPEELACQRLRLAQLTEPELWQRQHPIRNIIWCIQHVSISSSCWSLANPVLWRSEYRFVLSQFGDGIICLTICCPHSKQTKNKDSKCRTDSPMVSCRIKYRIRMCREDRMTHRLMVRRHRIRSVGLWVEAIRCILLCRKRKSGRRMRFHAKRFLCPPIKCRFMGTMDRWVGNCFLFRFLTLMLSHVTQTIFCSLSEISQKYVYSLHE